MKTGTKEIKFCIEKDWCKGCELCIDSCPRHLLSLSEDLNVSGYHYAVLQDPRECTGCGLCALMCPDLVIQIWKGE